MSEIWNSAAPAANNFNNGFSSDLYTFQLPNYESVYGGTGYTPGTTNYLNMGNYGANTANNSSSPLLDMFLGGKSKDGSSSPGLLTAGVGSIAGLAQAWAGIQQAKVAKDTLAFQKDAFNKSFENQRTLTNASLRDRQLARNIDSPGTYQSVSEYMAQNGV